jgi:putative membrane protein
MFCLWGLALAVSAIHPKEMSTWCMEVAPVIIAAPILWLTYGAFTLPRYIMIWIFIHGLILILGGHYTYAEVPLGFWLQEIFGLSRNPYDRIGHFFQGFVPALIAREILVRVVDLRKMGWVFFLSVCICLSISVFYEFIEWWAALILGQGAEAFLGTQGDVWDSHWDMLLAGIGAMSSLIIYRSRIRMLLTNQANLK